MTDRRGYRMPSWSGLLWPAAGAREAVGLMFGVFLLSDLAAGWLQAAGLAGFGFAVGSAAAAGRTRRRELLIVVTTPPLVFLCAATCAELIAVHLHHVAPSAGLVIAGIFLTLSASAPWLFGGLALTVVIAVVRGLPRCIRDLRSELAGTGPRPTRHQVPGARRYRGATR